MKELRARLMAVVEGVIMVEQNEQGEQETDEAEEPERDERDRPDEEAAEPPQRSDWFLWEKEEFSHEVKVYKRRKREALLEALGEVRAGQRRLSGRVMSVWAYQRKEVYRLAS